jgi:hypothetical protein
MDDSLIVRGSKKLRKTMGQNSKLSEEFELHYTSQSFLCVIHDKDIFVLFHVAFLHLVRKDFVCYYCFCC